MKKVIEDLKLNIGNNKVVLTCSTGVDSMTLLHLAMHSLPKENIIVAHVNHQRRVESKEEQAFIEKFCQENNLTLRILTLSKEYDGNFQEWARNQRYAFFGNVAKEFNAKYILLAHHANDNLETILMRLMKSSSLKGYAGIQKETKFDDLIIYRPLLETPKETIINYCKENNITYFEDASNNTSDYTRNRLRHQVIPLLLEENPNLYEAINNYSKTLFSANKLLEKVKLEFIENCLTVNTTNNKEILSFSINDFLNIDEDLRIHVLFRILKKYQLSRGCVEDVYNQIISSKTKIITSINNELSMIKEYGYVYFTNISLEKKQFYLEIKEYGEYNLLNNQKLIVDKNISYLKANNKTIWYNTMSLPIVVRNRKDGDKIKLKTGTKSVSDFLTDKKVPYIQRKDILVLCDQFDNILYILGYVTK